MSDADRATEAQWAEALRWMAKASQDRRSAVLVLADDPPLLEPAADHCQQAAEKLLKALLAAAGTNIPKTHDLRRLSKLAASLFPALAPGMSAVSDLTPWGTATRYPELEEEMGLHAVDIRAALLALDRLHEAIASLAPIKAP